MAVRITIERILRDPDDASGQTIRDWKLESESGHVTIRTNHGSGFIGMRADDVDLFVGDLLKAQDAARRLAEEPTDIT